MANIVLFVQNFRLGTKISEKLTDLNHNPVFAEGERFGLYQIDESTDMAILDLDDSVYQTIAFISGLRRMSKKLKIVGYMKVIHKETYERLKASGCDMILPKSSFVKNIHTLVS